MAKKGKKESEHKKYQMIMVVSVCIVALIAIISANTGNIGGEAIANPNIVCDTEDFCLSWQWTNETTYACQEYNYTEYRECVNYSWNPESQQVECSKWGTVNEEECIEWAEEKDWKRECIEWTQRESCRATKLAR